MNDIQTAGISAFIVLIGIVVGVWIGVQLDRTKYLPLVLQTDADARSYQKMCLDNGYGSNLHMSEEGAFVLTCERIRK